MHSGTFLGALAKRAIASSFSSRRHCLLIRGFQGRPGSYFGRTHTGLPAQQLVTRSWHRRHLCHRRNLGRSSRQPFRAPGHMPWRWHDWLKGVTSAEATRHTGSLSKYDQRRWLYSGCSARREGNKAERNSTGQGKGKSGDQRDTYTRYTASAPSWRKSGDVGQDFCEVRSNCAASELQQPPSAISNGSPRRTTPCWAGRLSLLRDRVGQGLLPQR